MSSGGVIESIDEAAQSILGMTGDELSARWITGTWRAWSTDGTLLEGNDRLIFRAARGERIRSEPVVLERGDGGRVTVAITAIADRTKGRLLVTLRELDMAPCRD